MEAWLDKARQAVWPEWSYEETIKIKMLFLEYLGAAFAKRGEEEGQRFAEHLEAFGGEEQATLLATGRLVAAQQAVLGNAMLTDAPLLFPTVLAAIELLNKGGKELIAALGAGLEGAYRMGDHPQAELFGALLGAANALELDEDGWAVLVGTVLNRYQEVPQKKISRALLAHDIVMAGALARDEWSEETAERGAIPEDWREALGRSTGEPGMNTFLMAADLNPDAMIGTFRERAAGHVPAPHLEYYVDAVMGLEDICCVPLFFRR